MNQNNNPPQIIKKFLVYMETIKGKSNRTINEYYLDLRTFFRFIKKYRNLIHHDCEFKDISISDIDLEFVKSITLSDIYEYLYYIMNERKNVSATRARKVSTLKSFFKYLTRKVNLLDKNPTEELDSPKIKKSLPHYLSLEQSINLLNNIKGENKERNYAIITLFLNCGMRLSELVGINLSDIQDNNLRLLGKGNKERFVYLNDACISAINDYLKVRPVDGVTDKDALFLSKRKKRISVKTVQWLVKKYIEESGLDKTRYSVHKLRHTAATLMYRNGVDVRVLQEILGHTNLGTTQIYTHIDDSTIKDAINANPLSKIKKNDNTK